ncbi:MAG: DUF4249 family protein, partial [Sphingobacteriales bacterium]
ANTVSEWKAQGDKVVPRGRDGLVYYCFANDTSSAILLGTTTKLSDDVVSQIPITHVFDSSEKISVRYSINLRQYALSKESYEFWDNLKKNTEQLGSVFDALPSQLPSNIHCVTDPNEPVIGYVDVSTVSVLRKFIDESELPNYQTIYPYECTEGEVFYNNKGQDEVASNLLNGIYIPIKPIYLPMSDIILGFTRTSAICGDCTIRGKVQQPSFWK